MFGKTLEGEQETEGGWHTEKIKNRHWGERRQGCRQWACSLVKDWISCVEKSTQSQHCRETSDCFCLSPSWSQQVQTKSRAKCSQRLKINKAWLPKSQLTDSILPFSTSLCFQGKNKTDKNQEFPHLSKSWEISSSTVQWPTEIQKHFVFFYGGSKRFPQSL